MALASGVGRRLPALRLRVRTPWTGLVLMSMLLMSVTLGCGLEDRHPLACDDENPCQMREQCHRNYCVPADDARAGGSGGDGAGQSGYGGDRDAGEVDAGSGCATGTDMHCSACGDACADGQRCCDGACTDVNTAANCGGCGNACDDGVSCDQGVCCDQNVCSGACVDFHSSPEHCGGCGNACGEGEACCSGMCLSPSECACSPLCGSGQTCCNGLCVTLGTRENCSRCGEDCGRGLTSACCPGGCKPAGALTCS